MSKYKKLCKFLATQCTISDEDLMEMDADMHALYKDLEDDVYSESDHLHPFDDAPLIDRMDL